MRYLGELREQPVEPPFTACENMDMQNLDVEIGFPVSRWLTGKEEIQPRKLLSGKVATCLHIGAYDKIEPAYTALSSWTAEQISETSGVAYKIYLNDPETTCPKELQTQIPFPWKSEVTQA